MSWVRAATCCAVRVTTYRQVEDILAGDGVVHQVLEHRLVGGLTVDETLSGASDNRLLDQTLFVKPVTQALLTLVGVVTQVGEQIVRAHELFQLGQHRVGFDEGISVGWF